MPTLILRRQSGLRHGGDTAPRKRVRLLSNCDTYHAKDHEGDEYDYNHQPYVVGHQTHLPSRKTVAGRLLLAGGGVPVVRGPAARPLR